MQTDNLELKKLVYLYLMNYAKSQPDMAIMAVNSFVKARPWMNLICFFFNIFQLGNILPRYLKLWLHILYCALRQIHLNKKCCLFFPCPHSDEKAAFLDLSILDSVFEKLSFWVTKRWIFIFSCCSVDVTVTPTVSHHRVPTEKSHQSCKDKPICGLAESFNYFFK